MINTKKYSFGFTAASMRLNDFVMVAQLMRDEQAVDHVNLLGGGKSATGKRMILEYEKRLSQLTEEQRNILIDGTLPTQKQIAFLAICRTNAFIRDFTVEVVREKILLFDYQLSEGDFITFLRRKSETHPELEAITDNTRNKIRQVTFKILEQAGIINNIKDKIIQPQWMEKETIHTIVNDNREWLKVFLMSDIDIENA